MPKGTSSTTPKSWPKEITYLTEPAYSPSITQELSTKLHEPPPGSTLMSTSPTPNTLHIRITPITEPTHPAYCQYGLFAAKDLKSDSFIIFYLGLVHAQSDADLDSDYDLSFDRELGVGIDSAAMGNEARFINDYRGIDDAPNAEFREVWVAMGNGKSEKRMGVFVLSAGRSGKRAKGIGKGREILVSYGKGFWKERGAPE